MSRRPLCPFIIRDTITIYAPIGPPGILRVFLWSSYSGLHALTRACYAGPRGSLHVGPYKGLSIRNIVMPRWARVYTVDGGF